MSVDWLRAGGRPGDGWRAPMLTDLRRGIGLLTIAALATSLLACASPEGGRRQANTYLRWATFEVPVNEHVLLRWPKEKMPLRVHLPGPPTGLFEDPLAIFDSVRDGVLDWTDAAGPGVPSFVFVDNAGDADIPIVWAKEPDGDWYIAFCAWDIQPLARRFGVSHLLVTGLVERRPRSRSSRCLCDGSARDGPRSGHRRPQPRSGGHHVFPHLPDCDERPE